MKFCTITQTSPWRKERDYDCHSGDEDVRTERGSDLSLVPRTSRALLAMLFLEESPLYSLLYTEPPGFLTSGSGWGVCRQCPPPPLVLQPLTTTSGFAAKAKLASLSCCGAPGLPVFCFRHLARWFWNQIWGGVGEREGDQPQGFSPSSTFPSV